MSQAPRPPTEVIQSIKSKAVSVQDAAAALTARIERFQEYLANLPGRVETKHFGPHPDAVTPQDDAEMNLVLYLHRKGKNWVLSCGSYNINGESDPFYEIEYTPLTEASLKFKMAAVKEFPNLLQAIEKSQDELVKELSKAASDYDSFEATLKPVPPPPPAPPIKKSVIVPASAATIARPTPKPPPPPPPRANFSATPPTKAKVVKEIDEVGDQRFIMPEGGDDVPSF